MNLNIYKSLIESNPLHIATVDEHNKPNISVATNVRILNENTLIISCNEMINTQKNIQVNDNIALTSFNKEWNGVRLFGTAKYYTSGEYYDYCKKTFFKNNKVSPFGATKPKGAIVVKIIKINEIK